MSREVRSAAVPTEHGGWSLTLEPAILGLLVSFSAPGAALAGAALLAFVARTPLKVVLVDHWRDRRLDRTRLARRIVAGEISGIAALAVLAIVTARAPFWPPLAAATPLILIELWHDMRSKSRRLIPELAGTLGIGSVATAVALAGGSEVGTAFGLWVVIAARSVAAVLFVRIQLLRFKGHRYTLWHSDIAQIAAVAIVVVGWVGDIVPMPAVVIIAVMATFELIAARLTPQRAAMIGAQQVVIGLTVVLVTALGVRAP